MPVPGYSGAVQPLEHSEDLLVELRRDADPVVRHGEAPEVAFTARTTRGSIGFSGPVYLIALPIRFWSSWIEVGLVHGDRGKLAAGDLGAALLDGAVEVQQRRVEREPRVDPADARGALEVAGPGVEQQVVEQALHPARALDDEPDELVRVGAEARRALLLEELAIRRDHPERLLQVVAGRVRELVEVLVRARSRARFESWSSRSSPCARRCPRPRRRRTAIRRSGVTTVFRSEIQTREPSGNSISWSAVGVVELTGAWLPSRPGSGLPVADFADQVDRSVVQRRQPAAGAGRPGSRRAARRPCVAR